MIHLEITQSTDTVRCEWCPQIKEYCSKCWKTVSDLLNKKETCDQEECDSSINIQYILIESSKIDPLSWILLYAESFRNIWEWGVRDQNEIKKRLYN